MITACTLSIRKEVHRGWHRSWLLLRDQVEVRCPPWCVERTVSTAAVTTLTSEAWAHTLNIVLSPTDGRFREVFGLPSNHASPPCLLSRLHCNPSPAVIRASSVGIVPLIAAGTLHACYAGSAVQISAGQSKTLASFRWVSRQRWTVNSSSSMRRRMRISIASRIACSVE